MWQTKKDNQKPRQNRLPVCQFCGAVGHTAFNCPRKPQSTLKTTKPMNKIGKVQKETTKAVARWKRTVSPNHQGYFECYICHRWIEYNMAEHVKSKVRRPDLRTDPNNLRPVCANCNEIKGSRNG